MAFLTIVVMVLGLICIAEAGAYFAKKERGHAAVGISFVGLGLVCLTFGIFASVVTWGNGNPDRPGRMDEDSVYQLVWQGQIDGKPYAVLVEMEDIQDLTSTDRSVRFYRLDAPLPPGTYYRCVKKRVDGVEKSLLEPFSLPVPATP